MVFETAARRWFVTADLWGPMPVRGCLWGIEGGRTRDRSPDGTRHRFRIPRPPGGRMATPGSAMPDPGVAAVHKPLRDTWIGAGENRHGAPMPPTRAVRSRSIGPLQEAQRNASRLAHPELGGVDLSHRVAVGPSPATDRRRIRGSAASHSGVRMAFPQGCLVRERPLEGGWARCESPPRPGPRTEPSARGTPHLLSTVLRARGCNPASGSRTDWAVCRRACWWMLAEHRTG